MAVNVKACVCVCVCVCASADQPKERVLERKQGVETSTTPVCSC